MSDDSSDLQAQVTALQSQVSALERKVSELQDQLGAAQAPNTAEDTDGDEDLSFPVSGPGG